MKVQKTKEQFHKEVDQRVIMLADMFVGEGKKFKHYKNFFEPIGVPVSSLAAIQRGERHFTTYNIWLCCQIYGASEAWILSCTGDVFAPKKQDSKMTLVKRVDRLEAIIMNKQA
jgi:hypothetical protein